MQNKHKKLIKLGWIILFLISIFFQNKTIYSQTNDDCFMCHEDHSLTKKRDGKTVSLYMDVNSLQNSVHKNVACVDCHYDVSDGDFPHAEELQKVDCGKCHIDENSKYFRGVHGQALRNNASHTPTCKECHGKTHSILPPSNPNSLTYKMNIPILCGKCHREGAPVSRTYNITEHNILENYSQSIHGQGLFKQGLIVTATCNNCHGNHLILPHTNSLSTISVNNIAKTCMQCHARIENVHKKIIKGELWEKKPGAIPACTDCHPPHKVNVQNIVASIADKQCLKCHEKDDIYKTEHDKKVSLKVNRADIDLSVHKNINCVKCHSDVSAKLKRPCETANTVDCGNCHNEVSTLYYESGHGKAYFAKDTNAPYCTDCHGKHSIKAKDDDTGPIFRSEIPKLCGNCHAKDKKATQNKGLKEENALADYSTSVHGRGLTEKGLLVSAICTDCHTTHHILKEADIYSSVNPKNVPSTCGNCHKGIYDEYITSEHSIEHNDESKKYPTCANCHSAHVISDVEKDKFMTEITLQCGSCHKYLAETYLETYHGKAYQLGNLKTARCSDCHGAHNILNVNNPNSAVGIHNIVNTCKKCHPDANKRFTGYLTHATHNEKSKYPILFYAFWAMTILLISVFGFFGLHILLWLPRSFMERRKNKHIKKEGPTVYVRRFSRSQRITHIFVICSFLLLVATGMALKFANMPWAKIMADLFGGIQMAGKIHRFGAIITIGYFIYHLYYLIRRKISGKIKFSKFIFSSKSLMFNKQDVKDFWATIKWFIGKGEKPRYGRWTYWEKFDYFAVFWGVAIIGFTGLMLWFPELFAKVLPGWLINVAQIVHSDEALLAAGFIFTIHFFNTHFRPQSFPMDTVIFTGYVPLDEFKNDRQREYEELEKSGRLNDILIKKEMSKTKLKWIKTFGFIFLAIGVTLVVLIIYSLLKG
ncbi:MAG: hypothetical protein GXO79_12500 [Chlorobi bacterium]|nr:hypothetical protein [Chlorobiota bacterium]